MKSLRIVIPAKLVPGLVLAVVSWAYGQADTVPLEPQPATGGQPLAMPQPVVVQSFESVELERLRLAEESAGIAREDAVFREQLLALQQKLARASLSVLPADQVPVPGLSDFRAFLSASAGDVDTSVAYYKVLTDALNALIPENPYANGPAVGEANIRRAEDSLILLSQYQEDEGISRNIMAQIAAVRGGVFESDQRRRMLQNERQALENRRKELMWNISVASQPNRLSGGRSAGAVALPAYREELSQVNERLGEIAAESQGLAPALQRAGVELQFQQFVVELAFQQRYIHSLLAAGFYRFYSRNMALSPEAYPSQQGGRSAEPAATGAGSPMIIPSFNSVPALETFLMNRISDSRKLRGSVDNMLMAGQISAAENLVRELVLTAKYQPELHTIPYEERQRILAFSELIRKLSDSLGSRDYEEIGMLAQAVEAVSADPGMADLRSFAEEHPRKALQWVRQADVAMKLGDEKSFRSLVTAAVSRAPLDPNVAEAVRRLEQEVLEGGEARADFKRLVEAGDYREIYRRRSDFARFSGSGADPALRESFEEMMELEGAVQEALKKCDEFEARQSYPDALIVLLDVPSGLSGDERIKERLGSVERRCEYFAEAYQRAREQDRQGNAPLSLAWYLTALGEAPASTAKLRPRVEELGRILAED